MSDIEFKESTVETFMGGTFKMVRPQNTEELAKFFQKVANEISSWGGDASLDLSEVYFQRNEIQVTLKT